MNKFIFIFLFLFVQNTFSQQLTGYVFTQQNKSTAFPLELSPFSTDGCTKFDDGPPDNPTLWQHCCVEHDIYYWLGGTAEERLKTDEIFYQCIKATGDSSPARLMYNGVRAAGGPLSHKMYRWGYGWNRVRDYAPLSQEEKNMAFAMYGNDLIDLKKNATQKSLPIVVPDNYGFVSSFSYSYCDEQIINYLSPKLVSSATVTKASAVEIGTAYTIRVQLDICEETLEFQFNGKTDSRSCKKDYAYRDDINRVSNAKISKNCSLKIRGL